MAVSVLRHQCSALVPSPLPQRNASAIPSSANPPRPHRPGLCLSFCHSPWESAVSVLRHQCVPHSSHSPLPNGMRPLFPRGRGSLYKNGPHDSPRSTRFRTPSPHSSPVSLAADPQPLCVDWKTPPPIDAACPLFLGTVFPPPHFWKPCTTSPPSRHGDLSPLSTLPPTTTTTTRNIYPFTLFLRSILPPGISPSHSTPRHHAKPLAMRAASHKMPPEIHRGNASHAPPCTT